MHGCMRCARSAHSTQLEFQRSITRRLSASLPWWLARPVRFMAGAIITWSLIAQWPSMQSGMQLPRPRRTWRYGMASVVAGWMRNCMLCATMVWIASHAIIVLPSVFIIILTSISGRFTIPMRIVRLGLWQCRLTSYMTPGGHILVVRMSGEWPRTVHWLRHRRRLHAGAHLPPNVASTAGNVPTATATGITSGLAVLAPNPNRPPRHLQRQRPKWANWIFHMTALIPLLHKLTCQHTWLFIGRFLYRSADLPNPITAASWKIVFVFWYAVY